MSSSFFYTASTVAISSSSRDSMGSDSTISPTISCPSPVSTPGGSSTPTSSSSLELDGIVRYGLIASTGFFLCSTLILMIVVVFLGRKIRTYKKKSGADTMPRSKDPSYWITDTDLEPPRVSCSTPNLSDWSTPPLSRPARSFLDSERMDHDFYPPFGMRDRSNLVPSASMTPLVPQNRELAVKKSASHSDLSGSLPEHRSKIQQRPLPPSPIFAPKNRSPTLSTGEETPKPMPRRKKGKKKQKSQSPAPITLETSGGETDLSLSFDLQYVNMHKLPTAETFSRPSKKSSAVYQTINLKSLDESSQYETLELHRK